MVLFLFVTDKIHALDSETPLSGGKMIVVISGSKLPRP